MGLVGQRWGGERGEGRSEKGGEEKGVENWEGEGEGREGDRQADEGSRKRGRQRRAGLCLASLGRPSGYGQTGARMGPPPILIPVSSTNTWQQGTWELGVDSEQADSGAGMFVASSLGGGPFRGTGTPPASEMALDLVAVPPLPISHSSGSRPTPN